MQIFVKSLPSIVTNQPKLMNQNLTKLNWI